VKIRRNVTLGENKNVNLPGCIVEVAINFDWDGRFAGTEPKTGLNVVACFLRNKNRTKQREAEKNSRVECRVHFGRTLATQKN
jgi:hypothetical protein